MSEDGVKVVDAPPTFEDAGKRTWTIKLTLGGIEAVQLATKVDLLPKGNDVTGITNLLFDDRLLGSVLWSLCEPAAKEQSIDRRQFFDALDAESLSKGWGALADAVVFFIRHRQGESVAKAVQGVLDAQMKVLEAGAVEMLAAIQSADVDEAIKKTAERIGRELRAEVASQFANSAMN
jgi:hypothetical protein